MKKINMSAAKLQLNKEPITTLTRQEQTYIQGGYTTILYESVYYTCQVQPLSPVASTVLHTTKP